MYIYIHTIVYIRYIYTYINIYIYIVISLLEGEPSNVVSGAHWVLMEPWAGGVSLHDTWGCGYHPTEDNRN